MAPGPALAAVVRGDRHAQLDHLGPERVVVVLAVDAVEVDVAGVPGDLGMVGGGILARDRLDRPLDAAGDVDDLQPQRLDREFQFLDAFLRRVQRNAGHRRQAVAVLAVLVGMEVVDGAVQRLAELIAGAQRRQHVVGKQHGIVRALLGQAFVEQLRQGVGGQVQRVARDPRPPGRAQGAVVLALGRGLLVPVLAAAPGGKARTEGLAQGIHQLAAAVVLDVVLQDRRVVVDMHVGVDHRVVQRRLDGGGS
ncbi:Uncharacterised protein [Achromobacter xylosoxidans]|nr:Uncharacterised protein [Achromobacter xylosoxidans]